MHAQFFHQLSLASAFFATLDDAFWNRSFAYTKQSGQRLRGDGARGMQSSVQSPDPPSRASPRDAESDASGASITRLASYRQFLESADLKRRLHSTRGGQEMWAQLVKSRCFNDQPQQVIFWNLIF
jgi:hypothetical protein